MLYMSGTSVSSSLKHLAERRTDIFGQEETYIGKKVILTTYPLENVNDQHTMFD